MLLASLDRLTVLGRNAIGRVSATRAKKLYRILLYCNILYYIILYICLLYHIVLYYLILLNTVFNGVIL